MPLPSSGSAVAEPSQQSPQPLESLAMEAYLSFLEDACAVWIRLATINSRLLQRPCDNMIEVLKKQLSSNLSGISSTSIRQEMLDRIKSSGRFPSSKYHNQYKCEAKVMTFDSESDRNVMNEVKKHGSICSSVCCTGVFIVETMLSVIINEDVREIRFDGQRSDQFLHAKKPLKKFVPFQIPAVLAHYAMSIEESYYVKNPQLERFIVKNVDILSRTYAMKNSMFEVLTMYDETMHYLELPGYLSQASEIGHQYGGFSEHLMMSITDIFKVKDNFEKMTSIVLGPEACSTLFKMKNSNGHCISFALFHGIGISCPNLRVLDLSLCTNVAAENLLYLFFHDAYCALHKYVYLPNYKLDQDDKVVQCDKYSKDYQVEPHDLTRYCPYCFDEWCANCVRDGCGFAEVKVPVIDDRLYQSILEQLGEDKAKYHLTNVIKASDLVASLNGKYYKLKRDGPAPWQPGHVLPEKKPLLYDVWNDPWYEPDKIAYVEDHEFSIPMMNPLCQSLEYLILNVDVFYPKHTIVPFMLAALPKIKSFGNITLVHALRMIRNIDKLKGISAANLEELEYIQSGLDFYRSDFAWASDEIYDLVDEFHRKDKLNEDTPEEILRQRLKSDVQLIAEECPNLKKIDMSLFGEKTYLYAHDHDIWQPFAQGLPNLVSMTLIGHKWSESEALVKAVGQRLKKLYLALRGFHTVSETNVAQGVPKLDQLLELCPKIQDLTVSFGPLTLNVTASVDEFNLEDIRMANLTQVTVHTYMTKKAFMYLWAAAPNLEKIKVVNELVIGENYPHAGDQAEFNENDVLKLFRSNAMVHLNKFEVSIRLRNIVTAKSFIDKLSPGVTSISQLVIRVALRQDHYPTQEQMMRDIAHEMNRMKQFKDFCAALKKKSGREIRWSWVRVGILESIGNLGLNNFDSDDD